MILYTVMPIEQVLQGSGDQTPRTVMEVRTGGAILEVEPLDGSRVRIVRLISPRPADYLDPDRAPGTILAWNSGGEPVRLP